MLEESSDVLQLWRACHCGNSTLVEELIDDGVDYWHTDRNGESVLHMAARANNPEVLEVLLDNMPDPDICNYNHQTPLHLAATRGHVKVVSMLLQAGSDPDLQTKYSKMTALHLACQSNEAGVAERLLHQGATCNIPDAIGKLPDFYTLNSEVLRKFSDHLPHCTHGRGKHPDSNTPTILTASSNRPTSTSTRQGTTEAGQRTTDEQTTTVSIGNHDQTADRSHQPDSGHERSKKNWNTGVQKVKKLKINHTLGFSAEHKARMEMNVFDRLMNKTKPK